MTNVLFVCLGNICRSPLAEAIFQREIQSRGLESQFYAESCGTANYHVGDPPDPRTIRNALKNGTPIRHVGRQFTEEDFERFDLILPMDLSNRSNLLRLAGAEIYQSKIKMMRYYDPVDRGAEVPDPYSGGEEDFQHVFEMLDRAVKALIDRLVAANGEIIP